MEMGSRSEGLSGPFGSSDSLNGLKFGKKIYFEDVGGVGGSFKAFAAGAVAVAPPPSPPPPPAAAAAAAAPTTTTTTQRKGKAVAQGVNQQQKQKHHHHQPPRCQVEGCKADLTGVKAYYCRHKVCGMHSKSPKEVVGGIEQRFCQQCSRFHQLHEFDQGKRSCRRRLAGHNERRRKPPAGPLSMRYGRLSSFCEDNIRFRSLLMDFSYPRPSRDIWPAVRAGDRVAGGNQLPGNPNASCSAVGTHPCLHHSSHYTSELPPSVCFAGVPDSSCALSLLSTQPWGTAAAPRSRAPSMSASSGLSGAPVGKQMVVTSSCTAHPWGVASDGAGRTNHEIQHAMGLGQFDDGGNGRFSGELELALQGNMHCPDHHHHHHNGPVRSYDDCGNGMHWSL